jgi:hypothetical protein
MPDRAVAKKIGRAVVVVGKRRRLLRIKNNNANYLYWTSEQIALIGTVKDKELANRLRCPELRVINKRRELNIPCWREKSATAKARWAKVKAAGKSRL